MGEGQVRFDVEEHTAILELSFEQFDHGLRVTFALLIVLDYLAELGNASVEWAKIALVVHSGFVHVIQDLLYGTSQILASDQYHQARTGWEGRGGTRPTADRLTRIDAI